MSEQLITAIVTVTTAIIGVAILAVLVSRQSNTSGVISAASKGLAQDLGAALSPVTGGGFTVGNGLINNFMG
jgi:hypothetical protein